MQKVKHLHNRLDAMENNHSVGGGLVMMTEQEAKAAGLNGGAKYLKVSNPETGVTFYYPDNGRLQSAES